MELITVLIFSIAFFPCICSRFRLHKDVTKEIVRKLQPSGEVPWRFFEISESGKLFAENVDVEDYKGFTALQHATYENLPKVLKALMRRTWMLINILDMASQHFTSQQS